jgi:hypothetical protein
VIEQTLAKPHYLVGRVQMRWSNLVGATHPDLWSRAWLSGLQMPEMKGQGIEECHLDNSELALFCPTAS